MPQHDLHGLPDRLDIAAQACVEPSWRSAPQATSLNSIMAKQIKAVFFDLGGTLFSYREIPKISRRVMQEAARRLGASEDLDSLNRAFARASRDFLNRDYYLHRDLFMASYQEIANQLGACPDDDFYAWFYEAQREVMVQGMVPREDCYATLSGLRDRGLSLSIVSNIDDDYLDPLMENLGLRPFFDHTSSSEEARSCKPHPGIFEYALRKAKVRSEEVVFVGDSLHHDIRGARDVGMLSVLIEESSRPSPGGDNGPEPDYVVNCLSDLLRVLDEIMKDS